MNKKIFILVSFAFLPLMKVYAAGTAPEMVCSVKNAAFTIGTAIVIIGWIIAGILYLTSMGNPEKTGIAKKAMIAAVIGTILIILADVAANVIANLLDVPGIDLTNC